MPNRTPNSTLFLQPARGFAIGIPLPDVLDTQTETMDERVSGENLLGVLSAVEMPTHQRRKQAIRLFLVGEKQEEIDRALGEAKKHPPKVARYYSETIENWRMFGKWNRKYGDITEAQRADAMIEWLERTLKSENPPYPLTKLQEMPLWKDERDLDLDDVEAFQVMWMERFAHIYKEEQAEQATPAENTIQAHAQDYLSLKKAQAGNKKKSVRTFPPNNG